ncbi:Succinate-semialdehyde dehydrogenase (plasmid) [Rhodococcus opacus PD630]|nr:Succinate-semialdehyde dehydrogenase [Rhodococcus opacus PD630]
MTTATAFAPTTGTQSVPTGLLIDGTWRDAADGRTFEVENPATGEVLSVIADGGPADADAALAAAVAAQQSWARTAPRARSEILRRAYDLVMARQDWLAEIMTSEMGKPLAEANGEVAYAAEFLRWFSEEAVRIGGDHTTTGDGTNRIIVTREPVGPCVLITPWNFPLAMGTRKIAPAVAAMSLIQICPQRNPAPRLRPGHGTAGLARRDHDLRDGQAARRGQW